MMEVEGQRERDGKMGRCYMSGQEDGGWDHKPRNEGSL